MLLKAQFSKKIMSSRLTKLITIVLVDKLFVMMHIINHKSVFNDCVFDTRICFYVKKTCISLFLFLYLQVPTKYQQVPTSTKYLQVDSSGKTMVVYCLHSRYSNSFCILLKKIVYAF